MNRLIAIQGNSQKLDGGAMFGHVPKAMWQKWMAPDEQNRITLACRALLVQEDNRNILFETGIGAFFDPDMRARYGVVEDQHVLLASLGKVGLTHEDIDIVVISHLHFDHAGGLLSEWQPDQSPTLLFPNAHYVVGEQAWERAIHPHMRDRASFVPVLNNLLQQSNRLVTVSELQCELLGEHYQFFYSNGHTPGLLHTLISLPGEEPILFASDLIPGTPWVHLPVAMGYDRSPELVVDEKKKLLDIVIERQAKLFYTHDAEVAISGVKCEKGKYMACDPVCL